MIVKAISPPTYEVPEGTIWEHTDTKAQSKWNGAAWEAVLHEKTPEPGRGQVDE